MLRSILMIVTFLSVLLKDNHPYDGYWLTEGLGLVFEINNSQVTAFEVTSQSCLSFGTGEIEDDIFSLEFVYGQRATFELSQNESDLLLDGDVYIAATLIPELPQVCVNGGTQQTDDPITNFEIFWRTFNENYALFDAYGVDWQAVYEKYRPLINEDTSQRELWQYFTQMLQPLKDDHVYLTDNRSQEYYGDIPSFNFNNIPRYVNLIQERYLSDTFISAANNQIFYGYLEEEVGYINILSFEGTGRDILASEQIIADAADEMIAYFEDAKTIIIDVRFNGGGTDRLALTLANHFADEERLAIEVSTQNGDVVVDTTTFTLTPEGQRQFTSDIYVLISSGTLSAAENFVLMMRTLPYVTVVGEITEGAFSNRIPRKLPNGWVFTLSPQRFVDAEGNLYEGLGITPDNLIELNPAQLRDQKDNVLDAVLAQIGQ